jgi:DNA-binding NtrC family response regulator
MSRRILIADDDPKMCQVLASGLARRGFTVAWRTSAREALALIDAEEFDVVVTDVQMPGMSGLDLCARLAVARPSLPVLVMTAFGGDDVRAAADRAGASGFLEKPFAFEDLVRALDGALEAYAELRAR